MNDTLIGEIVVPADHPSLAGHFPGNPIVPGVVLLDAVLAAIRTQRPCMLLSMPTVKFLQPVLPQERIELRIEFTPDNEGTLRARFQGSRRQSPVFEGTFVLSCGAAA
ncbi:MAG TPA: hypothetical protein PKE27_09455 [Povalibacter sp.]|uniref:3-hydroxyacyl-ACP dehydratase FabZ family protein n=1 Tax=Povalibacter sp. TaxID=1962978 RepID=UPI002C0913B3|nr:hypothetical protein [Povalibacter sp.]HMN44787.1 hypothetical protein [Povalibacter sp.]